MIKEKANELMLMHETSVRALEQGFLEAAKVIIKEEIERISQINEKIVGLSVRGYTPTWNDGDVCTHRARDPNIVIRLDNDEIKEIDRDDLLKEELKSLRDNDIELDLIEMCLDRRFFSKFCSILYGTDYACIFFLKDGDLNIDHKQWNPEW